jgi:hypothetical protein
MPLRLGINIGFITNSSSCVHHFPRELLKDPKVAAFLTAFELHEGFVGSELWSRDSCTTVAMTKEQKREVQTKLGEMEGYPAPAIDTEDDSVVIIYGDEYHSIAQVLARLLTEVAQSLGFTSLSQEYN